MHDFAITEHHSVFLDLPLVFDPKVMVASGELPFTFKKENGARFGVLPRMSANGSAVVWFDVVPCFMFHTLNAWEEASPHGSRPVVVVLGSRYPDFRLEFDASPLGFLHEWRLDLNTMQSAERSLGGSAYEFGAVHPARLGRPTRFGWVSTVAAFERGFDGINKVPSPPSCLGSCRARASMSRLVRCSCPRVSARGFSGRAAQIDLSTGDVLARADFGKGVYGGEMVFVPRAAAEGEDEGEDDGYLVGYVHDNAANVSSFLVLDAAPRSGSLPTVARVQLPSRVPYGFHGTVIPPPAAAAVV